MPKSKNRFKKCYVDQQNMHNNKKEELIDFNFKSIYSINNHNFNQEKFNTFLEEQNKLFKLKEIYEHNVKIIFFSIFINENINKKYISKYNEKIRYLDNKNFLFDYAHNMIKTLVKSGKISKASIFKCVDCGKQAQCYDHRDYSKPLDIVPVCIPCNARRGPGLNRNVLKPQIKHKHFLNYFEKHSNQAR